MKLECWDCSVFQAAYDYPCPVHCTGPQRQSLNAEMDRRLIAWAKAQGVTSEIAAPLIKSLLDADRN